MKSGYCKRCPKYTRCIDADRCPRVKPELNRIEHGRKKKKIEIVYEHEMEGETLNNWNECIYGKYENEK